VPHRLLSGRTGLLTEVGFEGGDFGEPSFVPLSAGEVGVDVIPRHLDRQFRANHARAQAEDIDVIVFDALVSGEAIVAGGRADPFELICGDAGSRAAAADEDGAFRLAAEDRQGYGLRIIRIVDRIGGTRSEIRCLVAFPGELLDDARLERHAGVIGSYGEFHSLRITADNRR